MLIRQLGEIDTAKLERLALLSEECGEVIQVIGKILRHGYESIHPNGGPNNRELLTAEVGDLLAAIDLMYKYQDIYPDEVFDAKNDKTERVNEYLHYNNTYKDGDHG